MDHFPKYYSARTFLAMCALLKRFQSASGCEFHYFMHCDTELPVPWLLRSHGLSIKTIRGNPYVLSQNYASLDLHLGGMLHSCILATGAAVPCVSLAYDSKHRGFFDLMGMSEFCPSASALHQRVYSIACTLLSSIGLFSLNGLLPAKSLVGTLN